MNLSWNMFAGGTSAARDKHSYQAITGGLNGREMYLVDPVSFENGRHSHYSVKYFGVRGYETLGKVRSPSAGKKLAADHYNKQVKINPSARGNDIFGVLQPGQRIQLHPGTDAWMRGDKFGEIVAVKSSRGSVKYYRVKMDRSGRTIKIAPRYVHEVVEFENPRTLKRNPSARGDDVAAHELALFIINDSELYNSQAQAIIVNLQRKIKRGVYSPALALKLWRYLADSGAKKYVYLYSDRMVSGVRQFQVAAWHRVKGYGIFTVPIREKAAKELADHYDEQVKSKSDPRTIRLRDYQPNPRAVAFSAHGKLFWATLLSGKHSYITPPFPGLRKAKSAALHMSRITGYSASLKKGSFEEYTKERESVRRELDAAYT